MQLKEVTTLSNIQSLIIATDNNTAFFELGYLNLMGGKRSFLTSPN